MKLSVFWRNLGTYCCLHFQGGSEPHWKIDRLYRTREEGESERTRGLVSLSRDGKEERSCAGQRGRVIKAKDSKINPRPSSAIDSFVVYLFQVYYFHWAAWNNVSSSPFLDLIEKPAVSPSLMLLQYNVPISPILP
jgi:hypothetical protein